MSDNDRMIIENVQEQDNASNASGSDEAPAQTESRQENWTTIEYMIIQISNFISNLKNQVYFMS